MPSITPAALSAFMENAKNAAAKRRVRIMNGSLELKFVANANEELRKTKYVVLTEEFAILAVVWTSGTSATRLRAVNKNFETAVGGIAISTSRIKEAGVETAREKILFDSPLASMSF